MDKGEILFEISGEKNRVHRRFVKTIDTAIIHLIRNAIDHGLEGEEERLSKGKECGRIEVDFYDTDRELCVEVRDNGAGVDVDKVYRSAIKKDSKFQISRSSTWIKRYR